MRELLALMLVLAAPAVAQVATLIGTVEDPSGARIIARKVQLRSLDARLETSVDQAGQFRFSSVPLGEYNLGVLNLGFRPLLMRISVDSPGEIQLAALRPELIRDPEPTPIGGEVLVPGTRTGGLSGATIVSSYPNFEEPPRNLAGVKVTLVCSDGQVCGEVLSDTNGQFSFDHLTSGVYSLRLEKEGFYHELAARIKVYEELMVHYGSFWLEQCSEPACDPQRRRKLPEISLE